MAPLDAQLVVIGAQEALAKWAERLNLRLTPQVFA
jgi:hypothetical protein